jgi:hypothetical protein
MSEKAKEKLRKPQTKVECPYWLKIGGLPIMKRYHFENCVLNLKQNKDGIKKWISTD